MRHLALTIALSLCPAFTACGEDAGLSFGSLQGSYSYSDSSVTCLGKVSGSKVTGTCDDAPYLHDSGEYYSKSVSHWTIEGTLGDSNVAARIVRTVNRTSWEDGWCSVRTQVTTYEGSASKSSGISGTGPFAAMAGSWSAAVTSETVWRGAHVEDGVSRADCIAGRGLPAVKDSSREVITWTSQATLTAQTGAITKRRTSSDYWSYDDDGSIDDQYHEGESYDSDTTSITATPSGDIVVDGYVVDKL